MLQRTLQNPNGKLFYLDHRPNYFYGRLLDAGSRYRNAPAPYFPPFDRNSRTRYKAANRLYPSETLRLTSQIRAFSDFRDINCFCELLSVGSSLECLFIMGLLVSKMRPALLAPYSLFPTLPNPIVCPKTRESVGHRPMPCLTNRDEAFFPQVSFLTQGLPAVDFLKHSKLNGWSITEIDGPGHDSRNDQSRENALKLRHVRLSEQDVLQFVRQGQAA